MKKIIFVAMAAAAFISAGMLTFYPALSQEHTFEGSSGSSQNVEALTGKAGDLPPGFSSAKEDLYRRIATKAGPETETGQKALVALANLYDEQLASLRSGPLNPAIRSRIDSTEAAMDVACSRYLAVKPPALGSGDPITMEKMMAWRCLAARQYRGDHAGLADLLSTLLESVPEWGAEIAPFALKLAMCKLILGDFREGVGVLEKALASSESTETAEAGHHADLMNDLLLDLRILPLMSPDEARNFVTETYLKAPPGTYSESLIIEWARNFMISGFSGKNGSGTSSGGGR